MNGWQDIPGYKAPVQQKTVRSKAGELAAALAELPPETDVEVLTGPEGFGDPTIVMYFPDSLKAHIYS